MRIFVTGASGWIGSGVVPELLEAGHHVVGLARSELSADALARAGADVHPGSLEDLESLRAGAAKSDGVIHLAFIHDFARYQGAVEADQRAIETLGAALEGSDRPLVIASGVAVLAPDRVATEEDPPSPDFPRGAAAAMTLALAARGVRSAVVRLPPTVHGRGDDGFVPTLIGVARMRGRSGYIGDGANRWPAVHRDDAARLFRLAVEDAPAGSILHAVADEGVPTRSVAEVIGRHLELPVTSVPAEQAGDHFGWLAPIFAFDAATSSALTRERFAWRPAGPGLIEDLDEGHYFAADAGRGLPV
ncbi:MAG TPA: SDR family oxidoreductase [Acidimicrobiales bacterium]|nr:SDR family oxidoreductase [Acidimicrobiales bacterium]